MLEILIGLLGVGLGAMGMYLYVVKKMIPEMIEDIKQNSVEENIAKIAKKTRIISKD